MTGVVGPVRALLASTLAISLGGCAIATDLINPDVYLQLGINPDGLRQSQGVVLVAFNNQTSGTATFFAFSSVDFVDLARESRSFSVTVPPNDVRNEVVRCPVELISPGTLQADLTIATLALQVVTADGATDVDYVGGALVSGTAFRCGDVIEIRASEVGDEIQLQVIVIPGQ